VEVSCTGYGFTQEMEKDLLQEYGMEDISDDESVSDEENCEGDENQEDNIDEYRKQLDEEVKYADQVPIKTPSTQEPSNIQKYIESMSKHIENNEKFDDPVEDGDTFEDAFDDLSLTGEGQAIPTAAELLDKFKKKNPIADSITETGSVGSNEAIVGPDDELTELDPNSREYRFKMVRKILEDARSVRSYSTTASTIAPSVISDRVKRTRAIKEKRELQKRSVPKGEASATNRMRKTNVDVVREHAGWDDF
jgi:RIO kinase 2